MAVLPYLCKSIWTTAFLITKPNNSLEPQQTFKVGPEPIVISRPVNAGYKL